MHRNLSAPLHPLASSPIYRISISQRQDKAIQFNSIQFNPTRVKIRKEPGYRAANYRVSSISPPDPRSHHPLSSPLLGPPTTTDGPCSKVVKINMSWSETCVSLEASKPHFSNLPTSMACLVFLMLRRIIRIWCLVPASPSLMAMSQKGHVSLPLGSHLDLPGAR